MYSLTTLTSLLTTTSLLLTTTLSLAQPLLHPRDGNPVNSPFCTGRGIGLSQADYLVLINQIDITATYDVPWDSTSLSSGRTTVANGETSMNVGMEDSNGDGTEDKGTITGLTLQYQLGLLNNQVNENQPACYSADGTYTYWLGAPISEGGDSLARERVPPA